MSTPRKPCPVPGCTRTAGQGKLMCWSHWRRVPKRLQSAVYRTYRAWMDQLPRARSSRDPDYAAATRAYDEAARAAVDSAAGGGGNRHDPEPHRHA